MTTFSRFDELASVGLRTMPDERLKGISDRLIGLRAALLSSPGCATSGQRDHLAWLNAHAARIISCIVDRDVTLIRGASTWQVVIDSSPQATLCCTDGSLKYDPLIHTPAIHLDLTNKSQTCQVVKLSVYACNQHQLCEQSCPGHPAHLNEAAQARSITPHQHFTKPPSLRSEALLVKALEHKTG
ncbi:MAG: hypothetical protein NZ750_11340 [Anaerolineae bacterium]|nr:hypothetical protein [Anaerolineae bacterium]MDW8172082.1 hypothetical protein [Anaerolineae bacterium]